MEEEWCEQSIHLKMMKDIKHSLEYHLVNHRFKLYQKYYYKRGSIVTENLPYPYNVVGGNYDTVPVYEIYKLVKRNVTRKMRRFYLFTKKKTISETKEKIVGYVNPVDKKIVVYDEDFYDDLQKFGQKNEFKKLMKCW